MGYVGIVLNGNWVQMADAMFGWMGIDIAGDDGYKFGRWPWQSNRRMMRRGTGIEGAPATPAQPASSTETPPKSQETPKK